jgi:hypothetical protein
MVVALVFGSVSISSTTTRSAGSFRARFFGIRPVRRLSASTTSRRRVW